MLVSSSSISGRVRALIVVFFIILAIALCFHPSSGFAADGNETGYVVTNTASNIGANIMNDVTSKFQSATQSWGTAFTTAGERLFWLLVPIALVWRMGKKALSGGGGIEVLADFTQFCIFIGFYFWLLHNGYTIAGAILSSMKQIAGEASGFQTALKPSEILQIGFNVLDKTIDALGLVTWKQIPEGLCFIITGTIFLIISGLIALNMMIALISMWVLMYAGVFILGFGATQWTSEMAIGYFRSVFSAALRIAGMILVVGICENIVNQYSVSFQSKTIGLQDCATMLLIGIVMYLLSNKVPEMLASLPSGHTGAHGASISGGQALAGAAAATAMTGAAIKMAATAASGGATAAMGAVQAAVTATNEGVENEIADALMARDNQEGNEGGSQNEQTTESDTQPGQTSEGNSQNEQTTEGGSQNEQTAESDTQPGQTSEGNSQNEQTTEGGSQNEQTAESDTQKSVTSTAGQLWEGAKATAKDKMDHGSAAFSEKLSQTFGGGISSRIAENARSERGDKLANHFTQQALKAGHNESTANEAGLIASSIIKSGGSVTDAKEATNNFLTEAAGSSPSSTAPETETTPSSSGTEQNTISGQAL